MVQLKVVEKQNDSKEMKLKADQEEQDRGRLFAPNKRTGTKKTDAM